MLGKAIANNTTMPVIGKSLDAAMLRSRVIANNIANLTTPGYKRVEVSFEAELKKALSKTKLRGTMTDSRHMDFGRKSIAKVKPVSYRPNDGTLPSGVNNVDIDTEMAKLAENQLMFSTGVKLKGNLMKILKSSIRGRIID